VKRSARPVTDRQPEGSLGWVVGGREAATGIGQVFLSTRPLLTSHRSHPEGSSVSEALTSAVVALVMWFLWLIDDVTATVQRIAASF
jgi:hypothetical protein